VAKVERHELDPLLPPHTSSNELTLRCVTQVAYWGSPTSGLHNLSRPEPAKVGTLVLARSVLPESQDDIQADKRRRTFCVVVHVVIQSILAAEAGLKSPGAVSK
jgi:hypothetical protein